MFALNSISRKANAKQITHGPQRLPAVAFIKMAGMAANKASARPAHPVNPCILMRIRYANAVAYSHLCPAVILHVSLSVCLCASNVATFVVIRPEEIIVIRIDLPWQPMLLASIGNVAISPRWPTAGRGLITSAQKYAKVCIQTARSRYLWMLTYA